MSSGAKQFADAFSSVLTGGPSPITLVTNTYDGGLSCPTGAPCPSTYIYHDSANFGYSSAWRGNLSRAVTPGSTRNIFYDMTGAVHRADDGYGHSVTITQSAANNYAAPSAITANSLTTSFTWDSYIWRCRRREDDCGYRARFTRGSPLEKVKPSNPSTTATVQIPSRGIPSACPLRIISIP